MAEQVSYHCRANTKHNIGGAIFVPKIIREQIGTHSIAILKIKLQIYRLDPNLVIAFKSYFAKEPSQQVRCLNQYV